MATKTVTKPVSRAELIKQRELLDKAIADGYQADTQAAVDAFVAGLKKSGIDLGDALTLLGVGKKTRAKRGTAKPKATGDKPKPGLTYKDPKTGEEWTAPANLRRAKKWLQDLVTSSGKKYEDFVAKK